MFLLLVFGILVGGYRIYLNNGRQSRQAVENELNTVGRLKKNQIVEWREERLADASDLMLSPFSPLAIADWKAKRSPEVTDLIRAKFRSLIRNHNYSNVLLVDVDGAVLLNLSGTPSRLAAEALQRLAIALRERKAILTDIHLDPESNTPELDLIVPLYNPEGDARTPLGAVIMSIDPSYFLYPLIQSWPVPSQSAETLLVRRDGNSVLFLNELRFRSNTALRLRIPIDKREVPSVKAVLGGQGVVQGLDYRGVKVMTFLQAIPNSTWFMVAKVDMDEAFAADQFESALIVGMVLGLLGVTFSVTGLLWQNAQKKYYRVAYELEQDRRQADEARLASEERYRALFENMVEGYAYCKMLFEHDQPQDFIYVDVNPAFEALTGLKDVVGQKVTQVVPDIKESNPELFEIYGRVSLTGKPERFETYLPALGIWFSISVFSPAKGYFVAVFDSVTERKRTEEDLRETNQVLRALVQASPLAIVALDYDGNLTRWNPAAERIFGWSQPEVLGKLFPGILQENLVDFRAKQRQMLQGQTIAIEVTHQKKDCSLIDINVFAAPMYDAEGKISSTMAVISDITERKRVEEALQRSEEKYRDLVNGINEGIFIHDNQGVITFANQTLANIHGFKGPEEIVGRKFTEFVSPATANDTIETFKKGMETGNYPEVINSPIIRTDGSEVFVEVRPSIIRDDSGKVVGGRGILQDVTERKRAEEEILRLNAELEQRVIERTAELEAANKELEAFSYSVSHDLRAPLRAIDGFSRFLFEDYSDILDDEGRRMINVIRQNTQNMGRLIDDLLSFSRLGRQEVKQSQIDMGELARAVFDELKPNTHERTMQLNINALPYAYVDRAMIQQVFVNLLSNAVKFTKPKEVAVIEVGGSTEGEENIYYVRDNGVGFDMRYIDKLFGVFQRLHRQDEFEGTGVGLALVKRIIHRHGGRVWAEGKMGEGATFYFTLPGLG